MTIDMQGNVWESCQDWFGENDNKQFQAEDPRGPLQGDERVLRDGCWYYHYHPGACRPAERGYHVPEVQSDGIGFRVAAVQESGTAGQLPNPSRSIP